MKKIIQIITSSLCLALGPATIQAATNYWDIDGATPGAGGTAPYGIWDIETSANWTTNLAGTVAGKTWSDSNDAVFSAGTDATGTYSVGFEGNPTVGNLYVEEGNITFSDYNYRLNLGGYTAGKGIIHIANGASLQLDTEIAQGDDNGLLTKTGAGTLTIAYWNYTQGMTVKEGVVAGANNAALSGSITVSNGAALHLLSPMTSGGSGTKILNGSGVDNTGAFRNRSSGNVLYMSGATLGSDARIQHDGQGHSEFNWDSVVAPIKRISGNNVNLTIGGSGTARIRLNISYPSFDIGTGVFTKEGTCLLQLEQPNYCSAFYLNGGSVYPRNEGQNGFGTNSTIFVEGTGGAFAALFQDVTVYKDIAVAAGANVGFICNRYVDVGVNYNINCNGVISGLGGLWKTNWGTTYLNHTNTYSGNTTIQWGPLALGANGSISNTPVIDIWTGGTFDVTAKTGPFVLGAAQTLKGNGTVAGNMTVVGGTIAPGASIGTLTFNGNLSLASAAKLLIEVDKSQSPTSDLMIVSGTLTKSGSGTVTVSNLNPGSPLAMGDTFQLFDKAVSNGQLFTVVGAGATWTNKLAVDGTIAVLIPPPPPVPATNLTISVSGTNCTLGGKGAANSVYNVYASTNVALPMASWWLLGATTSSGLGDILFLDSSATNKYRFYRFGQ